VQPFRPASSPGELRDLNCLTIVSPCPFGPANDPRGDEGSDYPRNTPIPVRNPTCSAPRRRTSQRWEAACAAGVSARWRRGQTSRGTVRLSGNPNRPTAGGAASAKVSFDIRDATLAAGSRPRIEPPASARASRIQGGSNLSGGEIRPLAFERPPSSAGIAASGSEVDRINACPRPW